MFGYCHASGIGLIPWSPLATGKLARPPSSAQTDRGETTKKMGIHEGAAEDEIIRRVEEMAKKKGWPMARVAIAWSMSKVTSPIIGINSVSTSSIISDASHANARQVERLDQAILGDRTLSEEESAYLEEPCVTP